MNSQEAIAQEAIAVGRAAGTEPFEIVLYNDRLILRGDLTDAPDVLAHCRSVLENIRPKFSRLLIEAWDARITPEGVTTWIDAVKCFLAGCELVYEPSQLGLILQYDARYEHSKSSFQDYMNSVSASKAAD